MADAIISLTVERSLDREIRVLRVLKLRGSGFMSGTHAYRVSPKGLEVFPRLADLGDASTYDLDTERISSGIPVLDAVLDSGYWRGASTLIAGPSGSGKTLMGLHFVFNGARMGEPGLIATLQENPTQLERIARGYGWTLDRDDVHLMYRAPIDVYLDEWVYDLLGEIERHKVKRVLIDSLGDLRAASTDDIRFREYVYSLLQRTTRAGISVVMTQEIRELFGATLLSEYGISHLSDNVVLLQFIRAESRIKRALTVMKTRASAHDQRIVEFEITSNGIEVGQRFADHEAWD